MPNQIYPLPSLELLEYLFELDRETGIVTWRNPPVGRGHRSKRGDVVGYSSGRGYLSCRVDHQDYRLHRIVFKLFHGRDPIGQLDHKDRNKLNNRPDNLREASQLENNFNRDRGVRGIHSIRMAGHLYFCATIYADGKRHDLGIHKTPVDAAKAYNEATLRLHGEFACPMDLDEVAAVPKSEIPKKPHRKDLRANSPAVKSFRTLDSYSV